MLSELDAKLSRMELSTRFASKGAPVIPIVSLTTAASIVQLSVLIVVCIVKKSLAFAGILISATIMKVIMASILLFTIQYFIALPLTADIVFTPLCGFIQVGQTTSLQTFGQ
jgi:hypothetical protein